MDGPGLNSDPDFGDLNLLNCLFAFIVLVDKLGP